MEDKKITINTFLSHRYKSPEINLFFFNLLQKYAEIQFELDEGALATNVTRLEKMISEADVFVGLYPIPNELGPTPTKTEMENSCKYFKLELDIASRQNKPVLCFIDQRYGTILPVSNSHYTIRYNHKEIFGEGGTPNQDKFVLKIRSFFEIIKKRIEYETHLKSVQSEHRKIIIFTDEGLGKDLILKEPFVQKLKSEIEKTFYVEVESKKPPLNLNEKLYGELNLIDFVVINVAKNQKLTLLLQLKGIPQLRINPTNETLNFLYGNFTIGYNKDIINTSIKKELFSEFQERILTINAPKLRINTFLEAERYFKKASLRKEAIFLSFSGDDITVAEEIVNLLKTKFSFVFNYRDKGESLTPGKPWIDKVFDSLAKSSLGIMLYSKSYFESENCLHELRHMMALRDSKKIKLLPLKLRENKDLELPEFVKDLQYMRYWEYGNKENVISLATNLIDGIK